MFAGSIVIDNRTTDLTITVGLTNVRVQGDASHKDSVFGDPTPLTVGPMSGEGTIKYVLDTGLSVDTTKDRVEMPITLSKSSGQTSTGKITIVTADGNTTPDFVVVQIATEAGGLATQEVSASGAEDFLLGAASIDDVNIVFMDGGVISGTAQTAENWFIDKAVDVGVSLAVG